MVICLERDADCLHMVQLLPVPSQNPINWPGVPSVVTVRQVRGSFAGRRAAAEAPAQIARGARSGGGEVVHVRRVRADVHASGPLAAPHAAPHRRQTVHVQPVRVPVRTCRPLATTSAGASPRRQGPQPASGHQTRSVSLLPP